MAFTDRARRRDHKPGLMCSMDRVLDADDRRYQPISLDIVGEETGQLRYAQRDQDEDVNLDRDLLGGPLVAGWRNNLTACSQRWNMYFVAHSNWIKVFVPGHRSNRLGRDEAYKFPVATKNPNAEGYMSRHEPHTVNHLTVGDLGTEEILLMAMDSGNVAAYYTSRIWDAICNAEEETKDSLETVCQPFFTYWVRASSWGLAIHKQARLIAVSSNNPDTMVPQRSSASVTIFAFALANPSEPDLLALGDDTDGEWLTGWVEDPTPAAPDRSRNWVRRIPCHLHNIPNISFINTNEDREGRFLLTTSITGEAILWDIWRSECLIERDFAKEPGFWRDPQVMAARIEFDGWNILALDPQSFQAVRTFDQFYGRCGLKSFACGTVDVRDSLLFLPGSQLDTDSDSDMEETEIDVPTIGRRRGGSRASAESNAEEVALLTPSRPELYFEDEEEGGSSGEGSNSEADIYDADGYPMPESSPRSSLYVDDEMQELHRDAPAEKHPQLSALDPTPARRIASPILNYQLPSFPAIHLSARNLRLFEAGTNKAPSVLCTNIVQYPARYPSQDTRALDRLIMSQCIPELGIVIIATQAGRAAVCTLTTAGPGGPNSIRVDWVLPFPSQEARMTRHSPSLLGIATSPIPDHQLLREDMPSPSTSESESSDNSEYVVQHQSWLRDRIDKSGVPITFDPYIIRPAGLSSTSSSAQSPLQKPRTRKSTQIKSIPPSHPSQTSPGSSRFERVSADTPMGDQPRDWHGIEYSRRFRLMLTYTNHTVLTYELSRPRPWMGEETGRRRNGR